MLFTTAQFAFLFLPITLIGFFAWGRWSRTAAAAWLFAASLFFYAYWMPEATLLLLGSMAFNFTLGRVIIYARQQSTSLGPWPVANWWLAIAITANLALLSYFKYASFFLGNLQALLGTTWSIGEVLLPIGISFYCFTQIAYLVDSWSGKVHEARAVHYGLFVSYFPHLVAGPVLHHAQMMPQFEHAQTYRFNPVNFTAGCAIFAMGLFKKVVLADGISPYADAVFNGADAGLSPTTVEAAMGALAYTAQLYFDFSGYSDMAIGLSRMFNVVLPFNFDSPYRATNISDFWRRWHISLSTFLRDYLYVPLGGNRKGTIRRYVNLSLTMILGGLWHGASWSFVLWGTLHGLYLVVHHGFRSLASRLGFLPMMEGRRAYRLMAWLLTFVAVVMAWVLFRAHTLTGASLIYQSLMSWWGATENVHMLLWNAGLHVDVGWMWCAVLVVASATLPNSNRLGMLSHEAAKASPATRTVIATASLLAIGLLILLNSTRSSASAFIYFNF